MQRVLRYCSPLSSKLMKRSSSGRPIMSEPCITLDPAEEQLTSLLHEASLNAAFSSSDIVIRYAGGWVRDKILQKPSHDIDIAISSLSGHEFAVQFAQYLTANRPDLKTGSITKILANPEKSKHLDTATSRFLSLDLDFVQLRTESYGTDSRTPDVVGVGTLQEDAERRDCTMNALYYNVHTRSIEDPTRRGLHDLSRKIITTPLKPQKTFLDDPLRVLRCIRFSSQFGFDIEAETFAEMKTMAVRKALKDKIVKERVGTEVLKMMKGIDPFKAISALHSQGLYQVVFCDTDPQTDRPKTTDLDYGVVERANEMLQVPEMLQSLHEYRADGRLWLIIAMLPYRHHLSDGPKKAGVRVPYGCVIIKDNLKLTGAHEVLVRAVFPPRPVAITQDSSPLDLGRLVRALGKDWRLALFVSCLDANLPAATALQCMERITQAGLDQAWNFTPFIDGKKIKTVLAKAGANIKVMKELMELVVEYRIESPEITEQEALSRLEHYLQNRPVGPDGW